MQNMILATPVLSDAAAITGSASSGDLGIGNLKKMSLKQVYRAANASAVFIVVDLLAEKDFNLVALIGHSGSSRSYARVRAAASEADLTADPGFDTGDQPFRSHQTGYDGTWAAGVDDEENGALEKNMFMQYFPVETYRYLRIDIADPNSDYLDIGRLYVSKAWQPETNMDYGMNEGIVDPSRKTRTVSGEVMAVERRKWRYAEFTLGFASKSEMFDGVFKIENMRGRTKDVLFIIDPDETDHLQYRTYYGTMENQPFSHVNFGLFSKTFRIEEIPS